MKGAVSALFFNYLKDTRHQCSPESLLLLWREIFPDISTLFCHPAWRRLSRVCLGGVRTKRSVLSFFLLSRFPSEIILLLKRNEPDLAWHYMMLQHITYSIVIRESVFLPVKYQLCCSHNIYELYMQYMYVLTTSIEKQIKYRQAEPT